MKIFYHVCVFAIVLFVGGFFYSLCQWLFTKNRLAPLLLLWTLLVVMEPKLTQDFISIGPLLYFNYMMFLTGGLSVLLLLICIVPTYFLITSTTARGGCGSSLIVYFSMVPVHLLCFYVYFRLSIFEYIFKILGNVVQNRSWYALLMVFSPTLSSFLLWCWRKPATGPNEADGVS